MRISDWSSDVCSSDLTLAWYDVPAGGTALGTGNSYDFITDGSTAPGVHTFSIAVVRNGCENPDRIAVEVTVTDASDADDLVAQGVTICEGPTTSTLTTEAAPEADNRRVGQEWGRTCRAR